MLQSLTPMLEVQNMEETISFDDTFLTVSKKFADNIFVEHIHEP